MIKKLITLTLLLSSLPCFATQSQLGESLKTKLSDIHDTAQFSRVFGSSTLLVGGSALFLLGSNRDHKAVYFIPGSLLLIGGLLGITHPTQFESLPDQWLDESERTESEVQRKVEMGEKYLKTLSEQARHERRISGAITTGVGVAQLSWYVADPNLKTLIYTGIITTGLGLFHLITPSVAENAYQDYLNEKTAYAHPTLAYEGLDFAPMEGGGGFMNFRFAFNVK